MSDVQFNDFSMQVTQALKAKCEQFLEEASFELQAETQRNTPTTETQLKGSWEHVVDEGKLEASVGSPLESALWNEFGTGSYAENGDGRKGWWVYVDGNGKSAHVSKTYPNEAEAEKAADFLRGKGLPAHPSNGKPKQRTLRNAYDSKKSAIIRRAEELMKEIGS